MANSPRTDWRLVLLLYLAGLGAAAQYGKVSVVFDRLSGIWPEAGAGLGFALSLVGFVGIVLGVTAGIVVAKVRYRRAVLWALWAGAALSAFQATLPSLPLFLASRVLEGMSHLALVVAIPTLIAQLSAPKDRPFTLTLWGTFFGVAFTILVWGGLPFADRAGLSGLFLAHAAFMAAMAAILTLVLPRVQTEVPEGDLSLAGILRRHGAIYRSPRLSAPAVAWLSYTFTYVSLLTLLPPFIAPEWRGAHRGRHAARQHRLLAHARRPPPPPHVRDHRHHAGLRGCGRLGPRPRGRPRRPAPLPRAGGKPRPRAGRGLRRRPGTQRDAPDRAQANGALAQTGNIGNTLGPPILLAIVGAGGYPAMMLTAAAILAAGIAAQQLLARRRAVTI